MKKSKIITIIFCLILLAANSVSANFTDIPSTHPNQQAINYLYELGVIKGYEDGTFKPNNNITRAEFTKIVLLADDQNNFDSTPSDCFDDIDKQEWYAQYICYAKSKKIVSGYEDETFKPANNITYVEAAKIILETLTSKNFSTEDEVWYYEYIKYLNQNKFAPDSIKNLDQPVTRAEIAEIIWRIQKNKTDLPSSNIALSSNCELNLEIAKNIDTDSINKTWLTWLNNVRTELGLPTFTYNNNLNSTAKLWSDISLKRGYIDHRRDGQLAYYDYNLIQNWFKDLGVEFELVNRTTYTETIGWGYYNCDSSNCTKELEDAMYSTYQFIMNEKDKAYRPHYNSLINPNFTQIGLGISVDESKNKYYLTLHYATSVTADSGFAACK